MKKSTVIKLYNLIEDKDLLKKNLSKLIYLNDDAEVIFYNFIFNHNDIINDDIFCDFISLSSYISKINDKEIEEKLINSIDKIYDNDYLVSRWDFDEITANLVNLVLSKLCDIFEVYDKYEEDYYKSEIVFDVSNSLSNTYDYNINKVFTHDMHDVFKYFFEVIEDLDNTIIDNNNDSVNKDYLDRIKLFLDIAFTKEIYELDDEKYLSALNIASVIRNNKELSKLKNKIIFYKNLDNENFKINLDYSVNILSDVSIDLFLKGKSKSLKFND